MSYKTQLALKSFLFFCGGLAFIYYGSNLLLTENSYYRYGGWFFILVSPRAFLESWNLYEAQSGDGDGMLIYGFIGAIMTIALMIFGFCIIFIEPSSIRWIGLVAIIGGVMVAVKIWYTLSIDSEESAGFKPSWHIAKVLNKAIGK